MVNQSETPLMPAVYSAKDVAKLFGVSNGCLNALIKQKQIPAPISAPLGNRFWRKVDIDEYLGIKQSALTSQMREEINDVLSRYFADIKTNIIKEINQMRR